MVGDEYLSLPSIITDGITDDTDDEITDAFGEKIRDVDGDVQDLEMAMRTRRPHHRSKHRQRRYQK